MNESFNSENPTPEINVTRLPREKTYHSVGVVHCTITYTTILCTAMYTLLYLSGYSCYTSLESKDSCDSIDANHFKIQSQQQVQSMPLSDHQQTNNYKIQATYL